MKGILMRYPILIAALALAGCATSYDLTVMPQDSGKLYSGVADDNGRGEGRISITIEDKAYSGTWVETTPSMTTGYVSGAVGFRRGGFGSFITMDNPQGGESKALLAAPDGSGLRCDFKAGQGRGCGVCRDDKGRLYDVQVRATRR
jgi:hypothetical protein